MFDRDFLTSYKTFLFLMFCSEVFHNNGNNFYLILLYIHKSSTCRPIDIDWVTDGKILSLLG